MINMRGFTTRVYGDFEDACAEINSITIALNEFAERYHSEKAKDLSRKLYIALKETGFYDN